jgi:hypothetical protein
MIAIAFREFEVIQLRATRVIGMVLPGGKIITFDRRTANGFIHGEASVPTTEEADPVSEAELTTEAKIAVTFARLAFILASDSSE